MLPRCGGPHGARSHGARGGDPTVAVVEVALAVVAAAGRAAARRLWAGVSLMSTCSALAAAIQP
jgi:hypothetical protein